MPQGQLHSCWVCHLYYLLLIVVNIADKSIRHYVAFIRKQLPDSKSGEVDWVLYNDEKVARGADAEEMKKFAYIYFLRRQ